MPSLHFGWAFIVAGAYVSIRRTRRSLWVMLHPAITLLAIVATANHYWLDAAVAGVLVVAAVALLKSAANINSSAALPAIAVPRTAWTPANGGAVVERARLERPTGRRPVERRMVRRTGGEMRFRNAAAPASGPAGIGA